MIPDDPAAPPGTGGGGEVFGAKTPPPATPSRNVGAFRLQHRRGIAIPGPSPLDSPPGDRVAPADREVQRIVMHPDFAIPGRGLTAERFCQTGPAPNADDCLNCQGLLLGPLVLSKKGAKGAVLCPSGFFSTAAAATFLCQDKEKWGPHPHPAKPGTSPVPRWGTFPISTWR